MCVKLLHDQTEKVSNFCLFFTLNLILTTHCPARGGQVIDFGVETSSNALIMGGWETLVDSSPLQRSKSIFFFFLAETDNRSILGRLSQELLAKQIRSDIQGSVESLSLESFETVPKLWPFLRAKTLI